MCVCVLIYERLVFHLEYSQQLYLIFCILLQFNYNEATLF